MYQRCDDCEFRAYFCDRCSLCPCECECWHGMDPRDYGGLWGDERHQGITHWRPIETVLVTSDVL